MVTSLLRLGPRFERGPAPDAAFSFTDLTARDTTARWLSRLLAGLVIIAATLSTAGCVSPWRLAPNEPWFPGYVTNRDGNYYVGSRCGTSLTEVGVFLSWPTTPRESRSYFDTAIWHATAPDGVTEFELFAADQPGVDTGKASGNYSVSDYLYIDIRGDGRPWSTWGGTPDKIATNMVGSAAGLMPWDKFMAMPNSDFGCR